MSDAAILVTVIIATVVIAAIVIWTLRTGALLILAFMHFVGELPLIVTLLMFIIFPPTLVVYLIGCALIWTGLAGKIIGDGKKKTGQEIIHPDGSSTRVDTRPADDKKSHHKGLAVGYIIMIIIAWVTFAVIMYYIGNLMRQG